MAHGFLTTFQEDTMGEKARKLHAVHPAEPKKHIPIKLTFIELQMINTHPSMRKLLGSESLQPITKLELYRLGQEMAKKVTMMNDERMVVINALCTKDENGKNKQTIDATGTIVTFSFPTPEAEKEAKEQIDEILKKQVEMSLGKVVIDLDKLPNNLLSVLDMLTLESIIVFREKPVSAGAPIDTVQ